VAVTAPILRRARVGRAAETVAGRPVESAVYTGTVRHRRFRPVRHEFTYRIALTFLRLDEVDAVLDRHPLWSRRRGSVVRFRRSDYLGDPTTDLADAVRDRVEVELGFRPEGPVALLAHVRTLGWCFNPLAAYYCYDATGTRVEAQVLSVTNTPWGESTEYVVDTRANPGAWTDRFAKTLHVSPFMGMDQHYRLGAEAPGDALHLVLRSEEAGRVVLDAGLDLVRHPADRTGLGRVLWRYPLMTLRVSLLIHLQALRLWRKGVPFHRHPRKEP
jgi:DUF1365 family protein